MIFKHIFGVFDFKATGDNALRFLNMVRNQNFAVYNLYCKNNDVYGRIYANKYSELETIAEKNYMQVKVVRKKGLILRIKPYKKRFGIITGIILSIIIIFIFSNITLKIRITGCDEKLYPQILSVLEMNGISAGKYIPNMNFNQAEMNMVLALKDIAWVSVRNSAGIITVNVNECTKKPDMTLKRLPSNIVSLKDAQIVDVHVYVGQLKVLIGEGVKKGDLLVSGFIPNSKGEFYYYHSQAEIIGRYSETISFEQSFEEDVKIPSKKEINKKYFNFFSIKVPLSLTKKPVGEYYYEENTNKFNFLCFKLPLGVSNCSYKPYYTKHIKYTQEEAKLKTEQKMSIYEDDFLNDCEIISKDIEEIQTDEKVIYKVTYLIEGNIANTNEILTKKSSNTLF